MTDAFVNSLLRSESIENSLKFAKSMFGDNDKKIHKGKKENPAEFKIYNGWSETLVDIVLKNPKGSISGYVVDDDGNPIENAEVEFVKITQIGYKPSSVKTDKNGYFFSEVKFDPDYNSCSFTIFVKADGYEEYIGESDEGFSAGENKNAGNFILSENKNDNEKNDNEKSEVPQIINNVLQNENMWIETINNQNDMAAYYNAVTGGDEYIWFQDMDMDGEPEFMTMSKYMSGTDAGTFRSFNIYGNNNNNLVFYCAENTAVPETSEFGSDVDGFESDTFNYSLWFNSNENSYHYLLGGTYGSSVIGGLSELEFKPEKEMFSEKPVITIYDENVPDKGCDINYISDENGVGYLFDNVLYNDGVKFYDDYFSGLTPCETIVKKIKLTDYIAMTKDEKTEALLNSYNSWGYTKNGNFRKPIEDVIDRIRSQASDAPVSNQFKELYKSLIQGLSFEDSINTIGYTLYDMNQDGIPELIMKTGTCEADYKLSFYTYRNEIGIIPIGTNFSGFHISFYVDKSTNNFCTHWGQMGVGGITWYSFDGESVSEFKRQNNIDYTNFENPDGAYAPYGNFESLNATYCYNSSDEGWITFANESSKTGIDYSMIDNY